MTDPVWHNSWSGSRVHWNQMFADLGLVGKPGLRFMEIGVFEGGSSYDLLTNVLTDPSSTLTMIDPLEFEDIGGEDQEQRIRRNLAPWIESGQAVLLPGRSEDVMREWDGYTCWFTKEELDFVYIDGDHFPAGVMRDAVLTWPLLKPGGHLLFDDYVYDLGSHRGPRYGVEAFVCAYEEELGDHGPVGPDQYLIEKSAAWVT